MRVLLSTIGSRGDVQPLIALAVALRAKGHQSRLCAPPDFRELAEGHGVPFVGVGPRVRHAGSPRSRGAGPPSPEVLRQLVADTIAGQFATIEPAGADCDVIVASTALQYAARSIAEHRGIPYFFAGYSPIVFPSDHHAPPPLPGPRSTEEGADNRTLWERQAEHWNELFGPALNQQRATRGLEPVSDVRSHMFTGEPLLAADPTLAPWPTPSDLQVTQTGAWVLSDPRPLPEELDRFLAAGEPPVYVGFGSTHTPQETGRMAVEAVRALDRRAIVSRGWADLVPAAGEPDCLSVSEVNVQALFPRVAAIVHHGGAGTTTAAARGGVPQVIAPRSYDQHYFAERIDDLGLGVGHAPTDPTPGSLVAALESALQPGVVARARSIAEAVRTDGAAVAAQHVTS